MQFPDEAEDSKPITEDFTISDALSGFIRRFNVTGSGNGNIIYVWIHYIFNCVKYTENIDIKESKRRA